MLDSLFSLGIMGTLVQISKFISAILHLLISGIHKIKYRLCGCEYQKSNLIVQFICTQWFAICPHTIVRLQTLRLFHAFIIQGKVNAYAYDIYNGLVQIINGAGLFKLKVSSSFRQQMRVYLTSF